MKFTKSRRSDERRGVWLGPTVAMALIISGTAAANAASPFNDQPASPQSLPGDNLPPFGMLDGNGKLPEPPPLPPGIELPGADAPPSSTAEGPTLAEALTLARTAIDYCESSGFRVGATVINSAGEARSMLAADGASGSFVFVGMRKALVALEFRMPSSEVHELISRQPKNLARITPPMFVEGGAMPLFRDGKIIGAIGVSGAAGKVIGRQDEICARAAADAFAELSAKD